MAEARQRLFVYDNRRRARQRPYVRRWGRKWPAIHLGWHTCAMPARGRPLTTSAGVIIGNGPAQALSWTFDSRLSRKRAMPVIVDGPLATGGRRVSGNGMAAASYLP